jgi:hypothetical protein
MTAPARFRSATRRASVCAGVAIGAYAARVCWTWMRYGHGAKLAKNDAWRDALLDSFMPVYEVVERHAIDVAAPAAVLLGTARDQDLLKSWVVRAVFKTREIVLGARPDGRSRPRGLMALVQSLGWGVLAEVPGRELIVGAVTKPWLPNVTFHAVPPEEFVGFSEPGFVKIAWTLRADAVTGTQSVFLTETRAVATDAVARVKFRRYWAFVSPGVALIRWLSLRPLKHEAERRARSTRAGLEPTTDQAG